MLTLNGMTPNRTAPNRMTLNGMTLNRTAPNRTDLNRTAEPAFTFTSLSHSA